MAKTTAKSAASKTRAQGKGDKPDYPSMQCPKCGLWNHAKRKACKDEECGHVFEKDHAANGSKPKAAKAPKANGKPAANGTEASWKESQIVAAVAFVNAVESPEEGQKLVDFVMKLR